MSSWKAIEDRSFLHPISVRVIKADHHNDEKLDWRLTVEDRSGKQFDLEIWQKHDPLVEWEEGVEYEVRNAYGQTWSNGQEKKLHSSKKWSVDRVDSNHDCRLMVMGDSHVGRQEHPNDPYKTVDCAGKFKQAIEAAISHKADCILHTGDVFHDYVTEAECDIVDSAFRRLERADVDIYYILGNHECDRGKTLLKRWERNGVAVHLDTGGVEMVPGVNVYGYDHVSPDKFAVEDMELPPFLKDPVSILVLHQTLAPVRSGAKVDLDEINSVPSGGFDYVISGHLHDPEQPAWENGELLYAGSTEDISTNPEPSDPSVWYLTIEDESIDTHRRKL